MSLETATWITELDSANPVGQQDYMTQGPAHIWLVKNVLLNTFANVGGAVSATHTELNLLDGHTAGAAFVSGTKKVFGQAAAPSGWTQDAGINDKVLRVTSGAGAGTGGAWAISGPVTPGHALTENEIPSHTHTADSQSHTHNAISKAWSGVLGSAATAVAAANPSTSTTRAGGAHTHTVDSTGGGAEHTHTVSGDGVWRPAYYDVIACTKD